MCVKIWCTQSIFFFIHIFIYLSKFFSYEIANLLKCDKILMLHVSDITHARPHSCHCTYCEIMRRQMCAKNWLINKLSVHSHSWTKILLLPLVTNDQRLDGVAEPVFIVHALLRASLGASAVRVRTYVSGFRVWRTFIIALRMCILNVCI